MMFLVLKVKHRVIRMVRSPVLIKKNNSIKNSSDNSKA